MNLDKSQLRRQLLKTRRSLPVPLWREKSDNLCKLMESISVFQQAKTILAYFSHRQEPDLSSLFTLPRQWGFSRCIEQELVWHRWQPNEPLQVGCYGIKEPLLDAPILTSKDIDLILVPAVACDAQGYRLGYGGGFFDRMFSTPEWDNIPKIGIVFDFAYLPKLPVDLWDKPLDGVCTETRMISF